MGYVQSDHRPGRTRIGCAAGRRSLTLAVILLGWLTSALAATPPGRLDRQKLTGVLADYVLNIANSMRWPEEVPPKAEPLTIAILGRDPIGSILDERMEGKTIAGRPLRAIRVNRPEELGNCDVVFMDQPTDSAVAAAAEAVAGRPVLLIVFEAEGGGSAAGVDLLLTREGTVRYKLKVSALKRAVLVPSPGLLQYALKGAARE